MAGVACQSDRGIARGQEMRLGKTNLSASWSYPETSQSLIGPRGVFSVSRVHGLHLKRLSTSSWPATDPDTKTRRPIEGFLPCACSVFSLCHQQGSPWNAAEERD